MIGPSFKISIPGTIIMAIQSISYLVTFIIRVVPIGANTITRTKYKFKRLF